MLWIVNFHIYYHHVKQKYIILIIKTFVHMYIFT